MAVFSPVPAALALGFLGGLALAGATGWLLLKGGERVGQHLSLLGEYFIGYSVTWSGVFVGFFYGFASVFAAAYLIMKIYNWVIRLKQ